MTLYPLTPDITVVLEQIGTVEVKNKDLKVDVQGKEVKVTYADNAEALQAYIDLLAALNALNTPVNFAIGDWVYIQFPVGMRDGKSYQLQIKKLPSDKAPYWELQDLATTKFWAVSSAVTLIKVLPVNLPS